MDVIPGIEEEKFRYVLSKGSSPAAQVYISVHFNLYILPIYLFDTIYIYLFILYTTDYFSGK